MKWGRLVETRFHVEHYLTGRRFAAGFRRLVVIAERALSNEVITPGPTTLEGAVRPSGELQATGRAVEGGRESGEGPAVVRFADFGGQGVQGSGGEVPDQKRVSAANEPRERAATCRSAIHRRRVAPFDFAQGWRESV